MAEFDCIVVGAGPHGLIAAHTWLELHPNGSILVIEADAEVGGTWSKSRIYPGLVTQTPVGNHEFTNFPMPQPDDATFWGYFNGKHVATYLEAFSQSKEFAGKTLKERIVFGSKVTGVKQVTWGGNQVWEIRVNSSQTYRATKLMMATGLTSNPRIPPFKSDNFTPPIIHNKYLGANATFLLSKDVSEVIVLGGAKSAFDAVQMLCRGGKSVTWVIRKTGQGPAILMGADAPPPLKSSNEIVSMRLISKLTPSIFEPLDSIARFCHQSKFGIWVTDLIWKLLSWQNLGPAKYSRNENFAQLTPERPVFWSSDTIAVCNAPDIWEMADKAKIYRGEVKSLSGEHVLLDNGESIRCDAVVACTGWDITYPMFSQKDAESCGLPLPTQEVSRAELIKWENLIAEADVDVLEKFPRLASAPNVPNRVPVQSTNHLYRNMVPSTRQDDHSLVFLGHVGIRDTFMIAEIQALWATAYLDGKLIVPSTKEMEKNVALVAAWRRRRYLSDGHTYIFDLLQYVSMLVRDLGLNDLRKGGGWKELLQPYGPEDYRGIVAEWKTAHHIQ